MEVKTQRDAASPRTEAANCSDDLGYGHTVLGEEVEKLEEVLLGLLRVDLVLVALDGDLAREVHLVLFGRRILLIGCFRAAHLGVRVREQLAQARRDGNLEVSDLHTALLQCITPFSTVSEYPSRATRLVSLPEGWARMIALTICTKRKIYSY